jgi:hypothetical protein
MPKRALKTTKLCKQSARTDDEDSDTLDTSNNMDSDVDSEVDPIEHQVNYKIQSVQSSQLMQLVAFFDDGKIINAKGDPTTNIIDRMKKCCYNVPERRIAKMFKLLESCRRGKVRLMVTERQQDISGIMIDFDIYQDVEEDQLTDKMFNKLTEKVFELLIALLDFPEKNFVEYVGITRRPKIIYKDDVECYKDGFHMLIPGIKIDRGVKLLMIQKLIENDLVEQVLSGIEPADIVIKGKKYERSDFVDKMSAHVPTFFIGSATKQGHMPYHLSHVFKVDVDIEHKSIYIQQDSDFRRGINVNICHEFSLNFEAPNGIIKKRVYEPQEKFASVITELSNKNKAQNDEVRNNFGELSMNNLHDGARTDIKGLLDVLNPRRAEGYKEWRDVLCALANTSVSYKDLAEYFSRKSKKFNMVSFETTWLGCISASITSRKSVTLGSIHYWAKIDNPERYKKLRESNVYNVLYNLVYEPFREGILGHADIGLLVHTLLKNKFVTDVPQGEKRRVWYEFVLEGDDHIEGELFKWHRCHDDPVSISKYISSTLPNLFKSVLNRVKQNYDRSSGDISKYYASVLKNFKSSTRKLLDRNYKQNVLKDASDQFAKRGFADKLDRDPLISGVSNGILKLTLAPHEGPTLIQGYHTHLVSQFTPVPFIPFDPSDKITRRILIALRNLFPDDEPDSFEFTMMYLASTIDRLPVESMFMITTGTGANGKSFLAELHKGAIGPTYGVKLPLSYLVCRSSHADNATPAVMLLQHASLATYSESNKHEVLNAARIKELTGLETIAGRKLHQDMVNFKPRAHHWVCSNFDLELGGSVDYGLERRIEYNPLKITFINPNINTYDKDNPYQRIADDTVTREWTEDPDVLGRYLGIMTWFHWHLYRKYKGKVKTVPHPHIRFETEKYIRRQDVIASFLAQRFIKVPVVESDGDTAAVPQQFAMVKEIQKYIKWYSMNHGSIPAKGLIETFQNSSIGKHITLTKRGLFLVGHKFLDCDEQPDEANGESYAMKNVHSLAIPEGNFDILPENADEFYDRTCREYEQVKQYFTQSDKHDIAVDTLVDYQAIGGTGYDQLTEMKNAGDLDYSDQRVDNIEINGRILPCGIVLKALESPRRNMVINTCHRDDMSGFLPDNGDIEVMSDLEDE